MDHDHEAASASGPAAERDLEWQYDNKARVPEHPAIMTGWARDAAAYRHARAGKCETGLRYGAHRRHVFDLFCPDDSSASLPLIVFIHGGYWRSLEPGLFSHLAAGANAHGFTVAMPAYRLCPKVTIPEIIDDLRAACLHLHLTHGGPLVACGHSAGGHLAAALAATDWGSWKQGAPADLVRRGLAVSGIFDLTPLLEISVNADLHLDAATARAASPAGWDVSGALRFEAWAGGAETAEYHRQGRLLAETWSERGAATRFTLVPDANHFTAPAPLADRDSALTRALAALASGP